METDTVASFGTIRARLQYTFSNAGCPGDASELLLDGTVQRRENVSVSDETNVVGGELEPCGTTPMTGFYRDGCCRSGPEDRGLHTVCAVMTEEFLKHQLQVGNDLSTPRPEYGFAGLQPGDRWCVVALRWAQAYRDGVAAPVVLAATNARSLEVLPLEALQEHAVDVPGDPSSLFDRH